LFYLPSAGIPAALHKSGAMNQLLLLREKKWGKLFDKQCRLVTRTKPFVYTPTMPMVMSRWSKYLLATRLD
jgi:hypothetical protein